MLSGRTQSSPYLCLAESAMSSPVLSWRSLDETLNIPLDETQTGTWAQEAIGLGWG
jgi:hypothetical protein